MPTAVSVRMFIGAFPGGPAEADDAPNLRAVAFDRSAGIKNVQITMSEPLRIGNQSGFQTVAQAKDHAPAVDIMVAQWLRFGGGGYLQMIGMSAPTSGRMR